MAPRFKIDEIYFYARSMIISSRSPIINSDMNTQKDRWNTFQIVTILFAKENQERKFFRFEEKNI